MNRIEMPSQWGYEIRMCETPGFSRWFESTECWPYAGKPFRYKRYYVIQDPDKEISWTEGFRGMMWSRRVEQGLRAVLEIEDWENTKYRKEDT